MKKTLFYSILLLVGLCLPLSVAAQTELQNKMKEIDENRKDDDEE